MHSPLAEVKPEISPPPGPAVKLSSGRKSLWLKSWRLGLIVFIFLALFLGSLALLHERKLSNAAQHARQTAPSPVDPGALRLKGTTEAVETRAILAPLIAGEHAGTLTIVKLTPAGTVVKQGDLLVEFDRQAQLRDFIDKQAAQSDLAEKVLEEQEKENVARAKDETEMKAAEDDLAKSELEIQKVEILSRIDAEKAQENLEGAKATLAQLKQTFDLKRKAAQASIRILEIQRDRNRETMAHAEANADLMQVHSPIDGIVVLNMIWKQGTMGEVQDGDQVRPGVPFMQVVDSSKMEVQVPINQEDLLGLKVGQSGTVHLDAYPALSFPGRLESIDPIGRSGDFSDKVRTFAAVFSITGHDPRLMPDLSAAIDISPSRNGNAAGGSQ
jgi:HlyD family secretion protein